MEGNGFDAPFLQEHLCLGYDDVTSVLDWLADPVPFCDDSDDLPRRYIRNMVDAQALPLVDFSSNLEPYKGQSVLVPHQRLDVREVYVDWQVASQRLYDMRRGSGAAEEDAAQGGFVVFVSRGRPLREHLEHDARPFVWHLPELQQMQSMLTVQVEDPLDLEEDNFPDLLEPLRHRGEGYEADVLDLFYCVYFPIVNYRVGVREECATAFGQQLDQMQAKASHFIQQHLESYCSFFANEQLPPWMHRQYTTLRQWLDDNQVLLDEFVMWCNFLVGPYLEAHAPTYALGESLLRAVAVNAIAAEKRAQMSFRPVGWLDDRFLGQQPEHASTGSAAETTDVEEEADEADGVPGLQKNSFDDHDRATA
jgi:hypothetical protein